MLSISFHYLFKTICLPSASCFLIEFFRYICFVYSLSYLFFRKTFQLMILGLCFAATLLACLHPVLNAFALMGLGIPSTALLIAEIRRYALQLLSVWLPFIVLHVVFVYKVSFLIFLASGKLN